MRSLAASLLFVSAVLQLLLGAVSLLGSGYRAMEPSSTVQRPSDTLVPEQLGKSSSPVIRRLSQQQGSAKPLLLGAGTLVAGLVGIAAGILLLRRKALKLVVAGVGLSAAMLIATALANGLQTSAAIALCLLGLALGGILLVWRRQAGAADRVEADVPG